MTGASSGVRGNAAIPRACCVICRRELKTNNATAHVEACRRKRDGLPKPPPADRRLPAFQRTLMADALVDLVAAVESRHEDQPDHVEPRLWLRRLELSVGYARQVLADAKVKDRRLTDGDGAAEAPRAGSPRRGGAAT